VAEVNYNPPVGLTSISFKGFGLSPLLGYQSMGPSLVQGTQRSVFRLYPRVVTGLILDASWTHQR